MFDPNEIPKMASKLSELGIADSAFCKEAEIAVTTWGRWKRGEFKPSYGAWQKVSRAFDKMTEASAA